MKQQEILIRKVKGEHHQYSATFHHEFLQTTYEVIFQGTMFGAIALIHFYEMIKEQFEMDKIHFIIVDENIQLKKSDILKVFGKRSA